MSWSIGFFRLDFIFSREVFLLKSWATVKCTRSEESLGAPLTEPMAFFISVRLGIQHCSGGERTLTTALMHWCGSGGKGVWDGFEGDLWERWRCGWWGGRFSNFGRGKLGGGQRGGHLRNGRGDRHGVGSPSTRYDGWGEGNRSNRRSFLRV